MIDDLMRVEGGGVCNDRRRAEDREKLKILTQKTLTHLSNRQRINDSKFKFKFASLSSISLSGHSVSTHSEVNTLPSQIFMKFGIQDNYASKTPNFQFLRKSVKRVKSYWPWKFLVHALTQNLWNAVSQKLFHLESSSWCHFLANWKGFLSM